jgi:predicted AAA+ superfamily ATPase
MPLVPRRHAAVLRRLLRTFPAVLVYGPRQSGKTTLVQITLPDWEYVDLERPRQLALLQADLDGWLDAHPRHIAIDEAQRMPELFPALRSALDARRAPGRVVLLGSASPSLLRSSSESLAGRIGLLELTPFLAAELAGTRSAALRWFWGGFPPVHALRANRARVEWIDDYVTTLLERDLPALGVQLPAARLRMLLQMLAHVHGNLLSLSDLARSIGVTHPTIARDLDVLEGVFLIRRLHPFYANIQKRLTKSPKLYIRDTGILHALAGLNKPADLDTWPRRGASFEGMVIEEVAALAREASSRSDVFFWRTEAGGEVDLIVTVGRHVIPIEIKLGAAIDHHTVRGLRQCMADLGLKKGWVISGGAERTKLGHDIEIIPWAEVVHRRCDFGIARAAR